MQNLITYTFKHNSVRTLVKDNAPWFVATDVAKALEYSDATHALRYLDDDERDTLPIKEGRILNIINESGLYSLILRSRKPEAKAFKKFVTSEVLPSIRKTGQYVAGEIAVRPYKRKLPSVKKEIVLSETEHKAIGGIVKKCVGAAIREEIYQALEVIFNPDPLKNKNVMNFYFSFKNALDKSIDDILCTADQKDLENRRLKRALKRANATLSQISQTAKEIEMI